MIFGDNINQEKKEKMQLSFILIILNESCKKLWYKTNKRNKKKTFKDLNLKLTNNGFSISSFPFQKRGKNKRES